MKPNEQEIAKAITAADNLASAGRLNATQVKEFVDYVVDESTFRGNARVVMCDTDWEVNKLALGNRGLLPAQEAADPGIRRGITTSKVQLVPAEVMLPVEVSDSFLEENIEGMSAEQRVVRMFATQFSNDLEGMAWHGNILGPAAVQNELVEGGSSTQYLKDGLHTLFNGWLTTADASGRIVDADNAEMDSKLVSKALRTLPTKYRRNPALLRAYGSTNLFQLWLEQLSNRGTALGDSVVTGDRPLRPFGLTPVAAPLLQFEPRIVKHVTLNGTTAASLGHKNITDVVVLPTTLTTTVLVTPYVNVTDYVVDAAAGTIVRDAGGAITDGQTVKVTFSAKPAMLLTPAQNLIVAISREIRIEKARDIYKRANGYAISCKIAIGVENTDSMVLVKNINDDVA